MATRERFDVKQANRGGLWGHSVGSDYPWSFPVIGGTKNGMRVYALNCVTGEESPRFPIRCETDGKMEPGALREATENAKAWLADRSAPSADNRRVLNRYVVTDIVERTVVAYDECDAIDLASRSISADCKLVNRYVAKA